MDNEDFQYVCIDDSYHKHGMLFKNYKEHVKHVIVTSNIFIE